MLSPGVLQVQRIDDRSAFRPPRLALLVALGSALGQGCRSLPRLPAQGVVAGHEFVGPVDSDLARRYLTGGDLPEDLRALRRRLRNAATPPSGAELREWTRRYSPDVATLLLVEALAADPGYEALRRLFQRELDALRRPPAAGAADAGLGGLCVLFVPGWFYRAHGAETGADFSRQRGVLRRLGVRNELLLVQENGTVEENAMAVASAVRGLAPEHPRLIVVSASKSSAEVALALGGLLEPDESGHVLAWLSVGGALRGTPLAERALRPSWCWWIWLRLRLRGFGLDGLRSLLPDARVRSFEALSFPEHLVRVSYVAVPLSGNIGRQGRTGYAYLRSFGPNDGLVLLADELSPGAHVLLAPGRDHFFADPELELHTQALLRTTLALAERSRAGALP